MSIQEYTGLKTLYLEQNAITAIENLDHLVNLRCLYLGRNMISEISGLQVKRCPMRSYGAN
jgi:Leucine-rich repeat (LRR) protein